MVFNTSFNNISVILWWSVLLIEETRLPGENYPSVFGISLTKISYTDTLFDVSFKFIQDFGLFSM